MFVDMASAGAPPVPATHLRPEERPAGAVQTLALLAAALLALTGVTGDYFPPWTSFHAEAPAFAASAVLLVAACGHGSRLRLTAPLCLLLALVASVWIQLAGGLLVYSGDAWIVTAYLLAFGAAWVWGYGAAKGRQPEYPVVVICVALIAMGVLATFHTLAQWLMVGAHFGPWVSDATSVRPSGNLGQPNQTATLLLMATAATAVLLWQARLSRPVAWLLFVILGWSVVLTQSRTAMLAVTLMAALLFLASMRSARLKERRADILGWITYMYFCAWLLQNVEIDGFVAGVGTSNLVGVGLRPVLWRQLLAGLTEHPWAGYGWLQTAGAQQAGALHVSGIEQAAYAHNAVLDALVFLGIPAGLGLIALVFVWLAKRMMRPNAASAAGAGLFVLLPLAVHMNLEMPHAYSYFLVPAGVLLGSFDARTEPAGGARWRVPGWVLAGLACLWIALLATLAFEYFLAEEDFRVNRFENRRVGRTPESYQPPKLHLLTQLGDTLHAMRLRAKPGMPAEELDTLLRTSRRYTWAPMHYRTALAMALNGRPEEATAQLRLIKSMFAATIYEEGRSDWIRAGEDEYPQLRSVTPP